MVVAATTEIQCVARCVFKKQTTKIHKYEKRFTHESALIQDGGAGNLLNAGDVLQ